MIVDAISTTRMDSNFVVINNPTYLTGREVGALAHELGHTLALGHGNGLDDNGDGQVELTVPLKVDS